MARVVVFLIAILALAAGIVWVAERPGTVEFVWLGYHIETSVMLVAVAVLALMVLLGVIWSALRFIIHGPQAIGDFFRSRRQSRGLKALSSGMIAANAGDVHGARHHAKQAERLLHDEPLTLLLTAQAAQLAKDKDAARAAFKTMAENDTTETIGLRGLYLDAVAEGEEARAHEFAERAAARSPALPWAANALLTHATRLGNWEATRRIVERNSDNRLIDKHDAKRLRAVLLTAEAQDKADSQPQAAADLALEAHKLAPDLIPAAVIAAQYLASTGQTGKALRVAEKTWKLSPHPDLAEVYAHARTGDSARDRLKRVRSLAQKTPHHEEGQIAIARAALEARDAQTAREALVPLVSGMPSQRVCLLMADIAEVESDKGKTREWLARAVRAPRDPAWTADGYVAAEWGPVSPVTGKLDAFEWRVPVTVLSMPADAEVENEAPFVGGALIAATAAGRVGDDDPAVDRDGDEAANDGDGDRHDGDMAVDITPVATEKAVDEAAVEAPAASTSETSDVVETAEMIAPKKTSTGETSAAGGDADDAPAKGPDGSTTDKIAPKPDAASDAQMVQGEPDRAGSRASQDEPSVQDGRPAPARQDVQERQGTEEHQDANGADKTAPVAIAAAAEEASAIVETMEGADPIAEGVAQRPMATTHVTAETADRPFIPPIPDDPGIDKDAKAAKESKRWRFKLF